MTNAETKGRVTVSISLREVAVGDLELLLAWRSNEVVYRYFSQQDGPLKWQEHWLWWMRRQNRKDWMILLTDGIGERRIGVVNVSELDREVPEIGLYIGEVTLWGYGAGTKAVQDAMAWLKEQGYRRCKAGMKAANERSVRLFRRLGFRQVSLAAAGRGIYEKDITK